MIQKKPEGYKPRKRKCKECKESFQPYNSIQPVCSPKCALVKVRREAEKQKFQEMKDRVTNWKGKLQDEVNKLVRLIDVGLPCLAKEGYYPNQYHAGHVFSRGSNTSMKYNLHNIHRQSAQSNHFQNDDGLLREGMVREHGQEYMDFVSELRQIPVLKYKDWEYKEFYDKAHAVWLRMKKIDIEGTYPLDMRMELRNNINIELGIYDERYCIYK